MCLMVGMPSVAISIASQRTDLVVAVGDGAIEACVDAARCVGVIGCGRYRGVRFLRATVSSIVSVIDDIACAICTAGEIAYIVIGVAECFAQRANLFGGAVIVVVLVLGDMVIGIGHGN